MRSQCQKMNWKGQEDTPTWRGVIKQFKVLHSNSTIVTRRVSMDICILVENCHKCCRSEVIVLWGMNFLINPKCNICFGQVHGMEGLKSHGDSQCQLQFSWTLYDWEGILPAIRFSFFLHKTAMCEWQVRPAYKQHCKIDYYVKSVNRHDLQSIWQCCSYYADLFHLFFCMHDSLNDLRFPWTTQGAFSMNLALSHHPWYRRQFRPLSSTYKGMIGYLK